MKLNFLNLRFSKQHKMLSNITLFLFLISTLIVSAQKPQRIAYIDMEYILENVPEYMEAQNTLDSKVAKWRGKLDKLSRYIEKIKNDLANERAILTNDLILDKEDEITLKQEELRRLESLYFGPNGDMFLLRKQLGPKETDGLPVDNLFTEWELAHELYSEIINYTYGKKKI